VVVAETTPILNKKQHNPRIKCLMCKTYRLKMKREREREREREKV
jgi:hypothetical protein